MRKALSYIGTLAFILQIASACTFAVLLHGERRDPSWHPGVLLNHWQGTMLNTSLNMLIASGALAIVGLCFPGSRVLAFITIVLVLPLVLLGGAFQGSS